MKLTSCMDAVCVIFRAGCDDFRKCIKKQGPKALYASQAICFSFQISGAAIFSRRKTVPPKTSECPNGMVISILSSHLKKTIHKLILLVIKKLQKSIRALSIIVIE